MNHILQLLTFFILFQNNNIYYSITTIIIMNIIYILYYKIKQKKNDKKFYIAIIITILASLTIILQNELIIKWKLTITYTILGTILINNSKNKKKLIIKKIGKNIIKLPKKIWIILNYIWGIFFLIIAIINIYISYKYNIKIWVYFKIFGITIITIVFLFIQIFYIKYIYKK